MRWELLPGSSNVYRFPVELVAKPTADLLRSVAPDVREVSLVAEAFGLEEPPMEVRNASDRAMAERIAATTCWPEDAKAKRAALEAMPKPLVERALRMCREAREAGLRSDDAAERFVGAELEGGYRRSRLGRVRLLGDGIGATSDRGLCRVRGGVGRGAGGLVCGARGGPAAVRRSGRGGGSLLRGGAPLPPPLLTRRKASHSLCWPVGGRGGKLEVDEVGAAARRSGVASVPDGAVAGEVGEELNHRDFRAVFGGEAGEAIGALSRAASTTDADDDVGVG